MPLEWTKDRPKVPGWYWTTRRIDGPIFMLHLIVPEGATTKRLYVQGHKYTFPASSYRGLYWYGPLEPPPFNEPKEVTK